MIRRSRSLAAVLPLAVLLAGLAGGCGKYGKPSRAVPEKPAAAATPVSPAASEAAPAPATRTPDDGGAAVPAAPAYRDETDPRLEGNRP